MLQHTQLTGDEAFISKLRLYTLCAPHLQVGGSSNNGYLIEVAGREILIAQKNSDMAGARRHG
jgi:glucoamylase